MKRILEVIRTAVMEGLVYDLVCHLLPALVAYGLLTGAPARLVNAVGNHMNGTAVAFEVEASHD